MRFSWRAFSSRQPWAQIRPRAWGIGGCAVAVGFLSACTVPSEEASPSPLNKITFDLTQLDEDGLYGPPGGKRALDYEFCIPAADPHPQTVLAIDPSLRLYPHSPGRIGCAADQILAIGNTHQPNAQAILMELANLDMIDRIDLVHWE